MLLHIIKVVISNRYYSQMWLAGSAFCDVLISIVMAFVVRSFRPLLLPVVHVSSDEPIQLSRANSTYKETQDFIRRIIILTMETGTLTGEWPGPYKLHASSVSVTRGTQRIFSYFDCAQL